MKAFPNIVLIDIAQVLAQVQRMMDQVALAVQFVFLFTLVAGLVVLYAAVASTQDERLFQAAVMRTLGASRAADPPRPPRRVHPDRRVAGFVAAAGASGLAYFVARRFLHLQYAPDPAVWLIGIAGGALGVAGCRIRSARRRVLARSPRRCARSLRRARLSVYFAGDARHPVSRFWRSPSSPCWSC